MHCHLDLGSECTLIRFSDAMRLGIGFTTGRNLPLFKGLGNIPYQPTGSSKVTIEVQDIVENDVEVLIVDDHLINYPVLLGHTFSERPGIKITKTANNLDISKTANDVKIHLICSSDSYVKPN